MDSRWSEVDAERLAAEYVGRGVNADMALRVYTTRSLGRDPRLVLHGGGNTSVKLRMKNLSGEDGDVLCVKGSGCDMAGIEPESLPTVLLVLPSSSAT